MSEVSEAVKAAQNKIQDFINDAVIELETKTGLTVKYIQVNDGISGVDKYKATLSMGVDDEN